MTRTLKVEIMVVVLAVVCLAAILLTIHYNFGFNGAKLSVTCWTGGVSVVHRSDGAHPFGFFFKRDYEQPVWRWTPSFVSRPGSGWFADIPLWIPFVTCCTIAAVVHRHVRKPKPGTCAKCGYNLTGNTSGACPECGTATGM